MIRNVAVVDSLQAYTSINASSVSVMALAIPRDTLDTLFGLLADRQDMIYRSLSAHSVAFSENLGEKLQNCLSPVPPPTAAFLFLLGLYDVVVLFPVDDLTAALHLASQFLVAHHLPHSFPMNVLDLRKFCRFLRIIPDERWNVHLFYWEISGRLNDFGFYANILTSLFIFEVKT